MTHPILALQTTLVAALAADTALTALIGSNAIFDAPPKGKSAPYIVIARHDMLPRDGDAAPAYEHRVLVHLWHADASRKSVLVVADAVTMVALSADLDSSSLLVTNRLCERTDTAIDLDTGQARAALTFSFYSEPN
jgi:hypothetical protein